MLKLYEFSSRMIGRSTGFHADKTWRQRREKGNDLAPAQLAFRDNLAIEAYRMDLKNLLAKIEIDNCNVLMHGKTP